MEKIQRAAREPGSAEQRGGANAETREVARGFIAIVTTPVHPPLASLSLLDRLGASTTGRFPTATLPSRPVGEQSTPLIGGRLTDRRGVPSRSPFALAKCPVIDTLNNL